MVAPYDLLFHEAIKIEDKICKNALTAIRTVKEATYRSRDLSLREAIIMHSMFDKLNQSISAENIHEGAKAFTEKRKPVWKD